MQTPQQTQGNEVRMVQANPETRSGKMDTDLRRWKDACSKWVRLLWVGNYEVTYQILDGPEHTMKGPHEAEFVTVATASVRPEYFRALLSVQRNRVRECTDDELDENACHEVMHIVMAPLDTVLYDAVESMPAGRREGWHTRRAYELERVTSHLTTVTRFLHRSPRGALLEAKKGCCHSHAKARPKRKKEKV